jgi:aryl-alcohol dehydrogenase-like predicted oxidoreductase
LRRGFEDGYLAFAEQLGIGTLAWAPLSSGLLAEGFEWEALHPDDFRRSLPLAAADKREQLAALRGT